jgi:hypothetical protein
MIVFEYTLLAFAVWRLTRLITTDEITSSLRKRVFDKYPPEKSNIGYLFTCDWCVSIWSSSAMMTMYKINSSTAMFVGGVLALSTATGLINRVID